MGSAFSFPCIDNSNDVFLVGSHLEDKFIDKIRKKNNFHPALQCKIPNRVKLLKFSEFDDKLKKNIDLLVVGVNSKGIEWISKEISKFYQESTDILLLTKGLAVIENKFETLAEKLKKILKKNGLKKTSISAVAGPCLANSLANRVKSSVVLANENIEIVKKISKLIQTDYYRTEFSNDIVGVEVCAAIKNIYSMLIGAAEGLSSDNLSTDLKKKYFLNTSASLIYKSLNEMKKITKKLKGEESTVYGLAGLGDLYVSAAGGRNSKMGNYLGNGILYSVAKEKYMKDVTIEGAELALEIGPLIMKEFDKKEFKLMISVLDTICNNKKLSISW